MTIIEIPFAEALELLQADDKTIEIHATAPGVEIRIPFTCTLEAAESAGPPPMLVPSGPAEDDHESGGNVCGHCGRTFASPNGLTIHIGRTHGKKPKRPAAKATPSKPYKAPDVEHTCGDCGMTFASGAGLGGHRKVHRATPEPAAEPDTDVTPIRGRECAEPGCTTRLSAYNKNDRCGVHDSLIVPPKFARASADA